MALNQNSIAFLLFCKKKGAGFDKTLMLGRQELYCSSEKIPELAATVGYNLEFPFIIDAGEKYCEPLFKLLGAATADSMDYSDYEKATIIHDLNEPVPASLKGKYSAIVDAGTLEHVFNFPGAIRNSMDMLETGGHFITITPVNNHLGHGFYQFSPELFFNVFTEANGFSVVSLLLTADNADGSIRDWYEVANPADVKERVHISNSRPLTLLVLAKKIKEQPVFLKWPQQSDYLSAWTFSDSISKNYKPEDISRIKFLYRKWIPTPVKNFIGNILNLFRKTSVQNEDLGEINPQHFRKLEFNKK